MDKALDSFPPEKRNKDGKGSWCRDCLRVYNSDKAKNVYRKNPEIRKRVKFRNFRLHRNHPERFMFLRTKARSKKVGIEFDLKLEDIVIPEKCPLLGIKLEMNKEQKGRGSALDSSPSLDRIDPKKGYVRSNVKVISMLANMIKSRATPDQIKLLASNLDAYISS